MTSDTSHVQQTADAAAPQRSSFGRLFTFTAAASLMLCVWVALGWYRSSTRAGPFGRLQVGSQSVGFYRGNLVYRWGIRPAFVFGTEPRPAGGFGPDGRLLPPRRVVRIACLPLAVGLAVLPAAWLVRRVGGGPLRKDERCPWCGYDVRTTPYRCPECGTELPALKQASSRGDGREKRKTTDASIDRFDRDEEPLDDNKWARK